MNGVPPHPAAIAPRPPAARLDTRILATMALVMVLASAVFATIFVAHYRRELLAERQQLSERLGATLQIALENAMLKRDLDGLRDIVANLGKLPNVHQVFIAAPSGEVRFASDPTLIGSRMVPSELCQGCGLGEGQSRTATSLLTTPAGHDILRSANAVANRAACQTCHGAMAEHPVNGYLVIDYRADTIAAKARSMAAFQTGLGILVILGALVATWLALRSFVLKPMRLFATIADKLANGDFAARDALNAATDGRTDEVAGLGKAVHAMAAKLDATMGEMQQHQAFQQSIMDGVPDGIRVLNAHGDVVAANSAFCRQAGLSLDEVIGKPCYYSSHGRSEFCVPTLVVCPLRQLENRTSAIKCSHTHVSHATHSQFAVEVVAAPVVIETAQGRQHFVVEAIRDLSEDMHISQQQRLSELGQLAAGVAHEILNPLSSIRLGLGAIRRQFPQDLAADSEMQDYLSVVDTEIDRCIRVTQRLMRLTRLSSEQGVLIDVGLIIADMCVLLRYEAEMAHVELRRDVADGLRIIADEGELGMVLLNLIQNAFHAMPSGGVITLKAHASADGFVVIAVSDTGHGIAEADASQIFHPFWSRRFDGSTGSGLGLSICKSLVERRHGTMAFTSTVGEGTTFILKFPDPDRAADPEQESA